MSSTNRKMRQLISVFHNSSVPALLLFSVLLTGCDGGLFGTGDGGDTNEIVSSSDLQGPAVGTTVPGSGPQDTTGSGVDSADNSEAESPATDPVSPEGEDGFSNTLPSGLDPLTAPVPALKLINLGDLPVSASFDDGTAMDNSVTALPGSTSEWLRVNTGETNIQLSSGQNALASFSPLNSVDDSLTTLIVSFMADASFDDVPSGESTEVSILPLDTRAVESASQMVEVRFIRAPSAESDVAQSRYRLVPDDSNIDGGDFMFTLPTDTSAQSRDYQLIVPGDYLFSSSVDSFAAMPVRLQANGVYTLIITGDTQYPVYVEVDSQVPE